RPTTARRPTNAWVLLAGVAPELADWAAYFSAGAGTRAAIEAGALGAATTRAADDQLRAAEQFVAIVDDILGILPVAG
ncbi:MAG: chromosome segregation protein SMC, partial [Actinobacteria bacterium]|nr:chromosome segregation protein SMC [Actinomycetota bacterium]